MTDTPLPEPAEIRFCVHAGKQQEPHVCPFLNDVHGDDKSLCTCCEECEQECADGI